MKCDPGVRNVVWETLSEYLEHFVPVLRNATARTAYAALFQRLLDLV
jgi:hypothetical protein